MGKINNALDNVKAAIEIADQLKQVKLKELLVLAKEDFVSAKEENVELREKNHNLTKRLSLQEELVLDKSVYWEKTDNERKQPFCPSCYAKGIKVPLQPDNQSTQITYFRCPSCKHAANPFDYHPERVVQSPSFQDFGFGV